MTTNIPTINDQLIHDIKTPLKRILLLNKGKKDPLSSQTNHCLKYLEELVNHYFKIESNNFIDTSIKNIIKTKAEIFRDIDIKITHETNIDQIAFLSIDEFKLNRVLYNLLGNAHKALENIKNPHIKIKTHNTDKHFYITISDNGCGFPPNIIKGFSHPNSHISDSIGLYAVKSILMESAGLMEISNHQYGAKVILQIPLIFKDAPEVYIFDDDPLTCSYISKELKKIKIDPIINCDLQIKPNSILFIDRFLNQKSGEALAREISHRVRCKIYIISNHINNHYDQSIIKAQIDKSSFIL